MFTLPGRLDDDGWVTDFQINKWATDFYVMEIARQCRFALEATQSLLREMERELRPSGQANYDAQAFLTAMANVSKLFKPGIPVGKKKDRHGFAEQRGQYLRELFKLSDESRVLDRTMRDHYEHYDERLDSWIMSHPYAKDDDSGSGSPPAGPIVPLRGIQESGLLELLGYNSKVEIASAMEELRQIYATAVEIVPLAKWATGLEQLISAIRSPGFVPLDAPTQYPDQR